MRADTPVTPGAGQLDRARGPGRARGDRHRCTSAPGTGSAGLRRVGVDRGEASACCTSAGMVLGSASWAKVGSRVPVTEAAGTGVEDGLVDDPVGEPELVPQRVVELGDGLGNAMPPVSGSRAAPRQHVRRSSRTPGGRAPAASAPDDPSEAHRVGGPLGEEDEHDVVRGEAQPVALGEQPRQAGGAALAGLDAVGVEEAHGLLRNPSSTVTNRS